MSAPQPPFSESARDVHVIIISVASTSAYTHNARKLGAQQCTMDDRGSERETAEATIVLQDSESPSASVQYKSSADSPGDEATGAGGSCEAEATIVAYVGPKPHSQMRSGNASLC